MNELEYDIIDELYFVTAYTDIQSALNLSDEVLIVNLENLVRRGFINCFYPDPDTEIEFLETDFTQKYRQYYFLATKAGLLAHNTRS